jgi:hypothetical protein
MNKKKVFKTIGIILIVVIILLLLHTIRNFWIISNLQNKFAQYANSTNFHLTISLDEDNSSNKTEFYKKDEKQVVFIYKDNIKTSHYDNGERIDTFTENENTKTFQINKLGQISVNLANGLETDSTWQTWVLGISATIKSVDYNGTECYLVKNFNSISNGSSEVIIEKSTGLMLKYTDSESNFERQYEFDNVSDDIFVEPNIAEYTLIEE